MYNYKCRLNPSPDSRPDMTSNKDNRLRTVGKEKFPMESRTFITKSNGLYLEENKHIFCIVFMCCAQFYVHSASTKWHITETHLD